ncbi:MAG: IS3 family transposase [Spirochaetaceae bacterium]|nr:IS3 family transposase [Spirochaetaceae bacterium]|tara:strand:- start:4981 stop:5826 length:846 start_codon:yes stop_codon:yes gene_type:complete
MKMLKDTFSVVRMARLLEVSRSGFYSHLKIEGKEPDAVESWLIIELRRLYDLHERCYGLRRLWDALKDEGYAYSRLTVARAMKKAGISGKKRKKFRLCTTDSNHSFPISPNLLKRNFHASGPNRVWVSDITQVRVGSRWLYLCAIQDLYSRRIVGWSMKSHMETSLLRDALEMATLQRGMHSGLIFHSDRGSQYASHEFRQTLGRHGFLSSMSRKGDCWDNACAESFFASMKKELNCRSFESIKDARNRIFDYIELFYNRRRKHSYLGNISPEQFEMQRVA